MKLAVFDSDYSSMGYNDRSFAVKFFEYTAAAFLAGLTSLAVKCDRPVSKDSYYTNAIL
jgi:hypothetical protein